MAEPLRTGDTAKEALSLITGDRHGDYGDAYDECKHIANVFNVIRRKSGISLSPIDVAWVLISLKIAREQNRHKHDNLVDLIGYADILNYCISRHQEEIGLALDEAEGGNP